MKLLYKKKERRIYIYSIYHKLKIFILFLNIEKKMKYLFLKDCFYVIDIFKKIV